MKTKRNSKAISMKKYSDGGAMKLSKNLVESRKKTIASKKSSLKKTRKTTKNMRKMSSVLEKVGEDSRIADSIVFNTEMRKTFIKGILQDIKGYFESRLDGKVEISYEDLKIGSFEFGFKLKFKRGLDCSKQIFSEVGSAACNVVNYVFPADEFEKFDLTTFVEDELIEFEILSNW